MSCFGVHSRSEYRSPRYSLTIDNRLHFSCPLFFSHTRNVSHGDNSLLFLFVYNGDLKPENILIQTENNILKLIDFGSAKRLKNGEPNIAYVVSRFYRYIPLLRISLFLVNVRSLLRTESQEFQVLLKFSLVIRSIPQNWMCGVRDVFCLRWYLASLFFLVVLLSEFYQTFSLIY